MIDLIKALPAVENLTLKDQEYVEAVRTAFGNLTDDQQKYVTAETIETLELAEGTDRKTSGCGSG